MSIVQKGQLILASDINNKVDKDGNNADFSNLSDEAKKNIASSCVSIPDYTQSQAISSGFVAPANGFVFGWASTSRGVYSIVINDITVAYWSFNGGNYGCVDGTGNAFVKKGDVITGNWQACYFCYLYN